MRFSERMYCQNPLELSTVELANEWEIRETVFRVISTHLIVHNNQISLSLGGAVSEFHRVAKISKVKYIGTVTAGIRHKSQYNYML